MDKEGEIDNNSKLNFFIQNHWYSIEKTCNGYSSHIGGVDKVHGLIGGTLRVIHHGSNCPPILWPLSFNE